MSGSRGEEEKDFPFLESFKLEKQDAIFISYENQNIETWMFILQHLSNISYYNIYQNISG